MEYQARAPTQRWQTASRRRSTSCSPSPKVRPVQRGSPGEGTEAPVAIEGPPPLARLAAVMALVDLFWNRVVVRVLAVADEEAAVALQRSGVFPRNLAAVAGLICLVAGLFGFLRMAGYSGLVRRLALSSVAGILLSTFVLALVIVKEQVPIYVVVAALAGTNVLVLLVGSVAVQYRAGARRAAALLVTASGALFILMLVSLTLRPIAESTVAGPIGLFCHHAGELVWHALPLAGLVALWRSHAGSPASEGPPLGVPGRVIAVLVTLATVLSALLLERHLHAHRFSTLVYGALRLTLLPESVSWLNGLAVGAALAVSGYGLLSRHPGRVQLGAGVALWLAGGFAPRAPGQLLDFALAAVLLARAAQAATPEGRARARIPWSNVSKEDAEAARAPLDPG